MGIRRCSPRNRRSGRSLGPARAKIIREQRRQKSPPRPRVESFEDVVRRMCSGQIGTERR